MLSAKDARSFVSQLHRLLPKGHSDTILCTISEPGYLALQARIVGVNANYFLKNGGFFVISIKASCIDSTAPPEAVFAREVKKLQELQLKPKEQVSRDLPQAGFTL